MEWTKSCVICGKQFITQAASAKCCGAECRRENGLIRNREKKERDKIRKAAKQHQTKVTVADIAVRAKAAGLSYGQYVARMDRINMREE